MTLINNCDTLENWSITNATEHDIDRTNQKEGIGCIRIVSDAKYACNAMYTQPGQSYDFVVDPIFKIHIQVPDKTLACLISFGDGTVWGGYYVQPQLVNGEWVLAAIDTRNTPDEGETPNWNAITRIRIEYRIRNVAGLQWFIDGPMEYVSDTPPPPPEHTLIIAATFGGSTDPAPDTYTHEEGTTISILANPTVGYVFERWTINDVENTSNPLSVTMDTDISVTAYFVEEPIPPPEGTVRVDCNTRGPPAPAGWTVNSNDGEITVQPYNGAIPRPPDVPAESAACIKGQNLSGRWAGYYTYQQPFGDWQNLTGEPVIRLRVFPEEYVEGQADIIGIHVILFSEENGWEEHSFPAKRVDGNPIVGGEWNTLEFDTRIDAQAGQNIIDISRVRAFVVSWRTYDRENPPAIYIDWIQSFAGSAIPPQVNVTPSTAFIYLGGYQTFQALVGGGEPPYTYQWYMGSPPNGNQIAGETSNSLYVTADNVGTFNYYVIVTDANSDTVTSEAVTLQVEAQPSPPPPAGPLHLEGRLIKDEAGNTVIWRGPIGNNFTFVDHSAGSWAPVGSIYGSGLLGYKPLTLQTHLDAVRDFGANMVRVMMPVYDWWNNTTVPIWTQEGDGTIKYRDLITQLLNWCKERGIYVIFTFFVVFPAHTWVNGVYTDIVGGGGQDLIPFVPYHSTAEGVVGPGGVTVYDIMPNGDAFAQFIIDFMSYYHDRGAADNLIIDPVNEASPIINEEAMLAHTACMQKIVDGLRSKGIKNIIVYQQDYGFDGSNWGYTGHGQNQHRFFDFIDSRPLTDPQNNIYYSAHIYPWHFMRRDPATGVVTGEGATDYDSVLMRITNYGNWVNPQTGLLEPHPEWGQHMDEYLARGLPIGVLETSYRCQNGVVDPASRECGLNLMNIVDGWNLSILGWWWCPLSTGPLWVGPFSIPPNYTQWGLDFRTFMRASVIPPGKGRLTLLAYANSDSVDATVNIENVGSVTTPTHIDLDPGQYALTATYEDQAAPTQTVTVVEGEQQQIVFQFEAPPTLPPIDVAAVLTGGLIIVDITLISYYLATLIGLL